jgi:hypothetical protein
MIEQDQNITKIAAVGEAQWRDVTIDALNRHWILGKQAGKRQPRWSIMRDWLSWAD